VSRARRGPRPVSTRADPDLVLVHRAARRAALQAAVLVATSFLLCGGLLLVLVTHGQSTSLDGQLRAAAGRADDVSDPPDGIVLVLRRPDGSVVQSPGTVAALVRRADLDAALAGGDGTRTVDVHLRGGEMRVLTQVRPEPAGRVVVRAAASLRPLHDERERLLAALAASGALALLLAAALGAVIGRRTVRGLVRTLRRQREFVADASHELRTPLTVLATRAQLLRRHLEAPPADDRARDGLRHEGDRLVADAARLGDVVEDLLAASEPAPEGASTDAVAVAHEVADSLRSVAETQQVRLDVAGLDRDEQGSVLVAAGAASLRRSLVALLDNAVRYTPPGGTAALGLAVQGDRALLTVTDTGPGIPPELRDRLFDRFASGDRLRDQEAGTADSGSQAPRRRYGLGLALVADSVHRAGGTVRVTSGPSGTRFTIELPCVEPARPRRRSLMPR